MLAINGSGVVRLLFYYTHCLLYLSLQWPMSLLSPQCPIPIRCKPRMLTGLHRFILPVPYYHYWFHCTGWMHSPSLSTEYCTGSTHSPNLSTGFTGSTLSPTLRITAQGRHIPLASNWIHSTASTHPLITQPGSRG